MREGFVFYRSFYESIKDMDNDTCAACFRALCEYGLNGVEEASDMIARAILIMAKPNIDKNAMKYENGKKGGRPNNQAEPKDNQAEPKDNQAEPKDNQAEPKDNQTKPNDNQTKPKDNQTKPNDNQRITKTEKAKPKEKEKETETETDTDTEKTKEKKERERCPSDTKRKQAFSPPTLADVYDYCIERGNQISPERFISRNEATGWMIGNSKVTDWKALVRSWEKQDAEGERAVSQGVSAQETAFFDFVVMDETTKGVAENVFARKLAEHEREGGAHE